MKERPSSFTAGKVIATVLGAPLTVCALQVLRAQVARGFDSLGALIGSAAALAAALCWWYAFGGPAAQGGASFRWAARGGVILGGIGLAAGFFGPIILTPGANQGPLLGIFITGPAGFIIGVLAV